MKLLGIRLCDHDSNITITDGTKIQYHKTERHYGVKHHHLAFDRLKDYLTEKGIDLSQIDDAAIIVDDQNITKVDDLVQSIGLRCKIEKLDHHLAHALSVWPISRTEENTTDFILDGFGDYQVHHTVLKGGLPKRKHQEWNLEEMDSLGMAFGRFGKEIQMHGSDIDFAGKLMALKSWYPKDVQFCNSLNNIHFINVGDIFNFDRWINHKGSKYVAENTMVEWFANLHMWLESTIVKYFNMYAKPDEKISFSGGVAQNICFNEQLGKKFTNLTIPPHATDEGLSLGAVEYLRRKHNLEHFDNSGFPYWQSDEAPETTASTETIKQSAELLAQGKVLGWYQGHGEVGPRALGNRSILMSPVQGAKQRVNEIKQREDYRPFGASVLKDKASKYFDIEDSPYMLYSCNVKDDRLKELTHVDGSCRPQTVDNSNPIFEELLYEVEKLTGLPILLNTSLNIQGKPICGKIEQAKQIKGLDNLIIGNERH
tara:strand:+ start:322 stop:1773 length:1452 start_codon:yes stop_codon:yes gene_type:complete